MQSLTFETRLQPHDIQFLSLFFFIVLWHLAEMHFCDIWNWRVGSFKAFIFHFSNAHTGLVVYCELSRARERIEQRKSSSCPFHLWICSLQDIYIFVFRFCLLSRLDITSFFCMRTDCAWFSAGEKHIADDDDNNIARNELVVRFAHTFFTDCCCCSRSACTF